MGENKSLNFLIMVYINTKKSVFRHVYNHGMIVTGSNSLNPTTTKLPENSTRKWSTIRIHSILDVYVITRKIIRCFSIVISNCLTSTWAFMIKQPSLVKSYRNASIWTIALQNSGSALILRLQSEMLNQVKFRTYFKNVVRSCI
jgi:hypothetical protein